MFIPKVGVPFLGLPIKRILVLWDLYWDRAILGMYHVAMVGSSVCQDLGMFMAWNPGFRAFWWGCQAITSSFGLQGLDFSIPNRAQSPSKPLCEPSVHVILLFHGMGFSCFGMA